MFAAARTDFRTWRRQYLQFIVRTRQRFNVLITADLLFGVRFSLTGIFLISLLFSLLSLLSLQPGGSLLSLQPGGILSRLQQVGSLSRLQPVGSHLHSIFCLLLQLIFCLLFLLSQLSF